MTTIVPPQIKLSSNSVMHDEEIGISLLGFEPWARVSLVLETKIDNTEFVSKVDFHADTNGQIDVAKQAPITGSYQGVDIMGLFWSMVAMTPEQGGPLTSSGNPWDIHPPQEYHLTAYLGDEKVASASFERVIAPDGVKVVCLTEGRLRGVLFIPPGEGPHPALMAVSGSGGGYPTEGAVALAGRGFAVLALAYFNAPDLPDQLVEIPLEYFEEGLEWLAKNSEIDSDRIGVIGGSRGGELSLLLGVYFPQISVVIAKVPSHVVWPGCCTEEAFGKPSWTWKGKAITAMTIPEVANRAKSYWNDVKEEWLGFYWLGLGNTQAEMAAIIPVEKINGPIMLVTGADDRCWPATYMADKIMERLDEHGYPHPYVHLRYDDTGHTAGSLPYWPTERLVNPMHPLLGEPIALGGTAEALARSCVDAWGNMIGFLEMAFTRKSKP